HFSPGAPNTKWSPRNPESPEAHRTLLRAAPETLFRLPEGRPRSTTRIESAAQALEARASQPTGFRMFGFLDMNISPENLFYRSPRGVKRAPPGFSWAA